MERVCVCLCIYVSKCVLIDIYMDSLTLNLQTTPTTATATPVQHYADTAVLGLLKLKCHSITIFRVAIKCDQNQANKGLHTTKYAL